VLYVIPTLRVGGAERHLALVAPRLDTRLWHARVFCTRDLGPLAATLRAGGIEVTVASGAGLARRFPPARALCLAVAWLQLFGLMIRWRPRIAHFFLPEGYVLGATAAIAAGVPRRIMSRRSLATYRRAGSAFDRLERLLHRGMTVILANSRGVARDLAGEVDAGRTPVRLLYNGIDLAPFAEPTAASLRATLGIDADDVVIVMAANIHPNKAHDMVIEALASIDDAPSGGRWRLLAIGGVRDIAYARRLRDRADALGIADRIVWAGLRSDVAGLLRVCDIGVSSSDAEGFSNAILEAMAAGLPVVATDVGGSGEAVVDGETGYLVAPRDREGLACALDRLLRDPDLRRRLGDAGRRRVEQRFSLERCVADYESLYRDLGREADR